MTDEKHGDSAGDLSLSKETLKDLTTDGDDVRGGARELGSKDASTPCTSCSGCAGTSYNTCA